jgi:hypothetical protein
MGSSTSPSFEMGNNATVKAAKDVKVSTAAEPDSGRSSTLNYHDKDQLERMGKKQVLRVCYCYRTIFMRFIQLLTDSQRNFGFLSILGFSCTILIAWEAVLVLFAQGLNNGGTAGVIYSFIVVWIGNFSVFATMCELVSMAPTSGGQYHW